ncbi:MAG TPA: glycosyltransferase family 39 protein [Candidatus Binatia bacterium]
MSATETRRQADWLAGSRVALVLLCLLCLFALFDNLGGAALFDPDEGRNAEIAREILITGDWVTPYYDFLPRLEKPIFFYALTALAYKGFGVSEASARLPAAVFALATLLLTYFFARRRGEWAALWSGLVLLTGIEVVVFSRIVILDMTLAFFITLTLVAFYSASAESARQKRRYYFLMYAAAACAALVKGPVGFVLPGIIIAIYIAAGRKWSILAEMELGWGILIFILISAPWYALEETRHPGYLAYFLGQEHFGRYLTPYFQRGKPWYFFLGVLAAGFFPWTFLLPSVAKRLWKNPLDDLSVYLILWAIVPFVFFSFSRSKMAEYLLPIFPALSILTGKSITDVLKTASSWEIWLLSLLWSALNLSLMYLFLGWLRPGILPADIRGTVPQLPVTAIAALALLSFVVLPWTARATFTKNNDRLFLLACLVFFLFFCFAHRFVEPFSLTRSYKELAARSAPHIRPEDQLVIYDNVYLPSLPFYLRINKPIWIVAPEDAKDIMGSFYAAEKKLPAAPGYGKVVFTFDEFGQQWSRRKLLVFIREKRVAELPGAKLLLRAGAFALVTNR